MLESVYFPFTLESTILTVIHVMMIICDTTPMMFAIATIITSIQKLWESPSIAINSNVMPLYQTAMKIPSTGMKNEINMNPSDRNKPVYFNPMAIPPTPAPKKKCTGENKPK